jgi:pSer/pThr/pTyr-binding forkhead associated (FHA) protein
MPTLILKFKEKKIKEFQVTGGKSLTIGRREDSDVFIDNLAVSGHHARIELDGTRFKLTDLNSKNGTFVNENLVNSSYLNHGDIITIGKHTLVFAYTPDEALPQPPVASLEQKVNDGIDLDKTMVMDTEKYRSMLGKNISKEGHVKEKTTPEIQQPLSDTKKLKLKGFLSFLTGNFEELQLSKKITKIGKNLSCDIVVKGFFVGKVVATISKRPKGFYLSYVGGLTKPRVNGQKITRALQLKEFDIIEVGSIKMQLIYKV